MANIESKVEETIKPIIEKLGYDLYDVLYLKEGKDYYLRIVIDNDKGIDLKDCEKVNDAINDILDEKDYIKEQYFLEVSSPGLERLLRKEKHFLAQIGNEIQINLFRPLNKKKELIGVLKSFENNEITIEIENEILKLKMKDIVSAKTVFDFEGGI